MLYGKTDNIRFQSEYQINGTAAHSAIDEKGYSERAEVITLSLPLRTVQSNTKLPATGYFLYLLLERLQ